MKLEDYSKYYIQGTDHYLIPKDEFVELFNEMTNWKEESVELKKQLEKRTKMYQNAYNYSQKMEGKAIILENQQKEFIKYLEDESKEIYRDGGLRQNIFRQILQKYREIIGDDK